MDEKTAKVILKACAEKIQNLETTVFLKAAEVDRLKEENAKLKETNKQLQESVLYYENALQPTEEKENGKL